MLKRPASARMVESIRMHAMAPEVLYEITDLDSGRKQTTTGEQLRSTGLEVKLKTAPDSALFRYRRERDASASRP